MLYNIIDTIINFEQTKAISCAILLVSTAMIFGLQCFTCDNLRRASTGNTAD